MNHVYLSWHDTEELISNLIFNLNTPYDSILMIARGGIIPGGMIAEALKMQDVLTATVLFNDEREQAISQAATKNFSWPRFVQFPADSLLEGRKLLIVDNLWNRGRTVMAAKGRIEGAGGFPEIAVLHWRPESSLFPEDEPDHYVEITEDFIHYPWQRIDDSDYRVLANPRLPSLS